MFLNALLLCLSVVTLLAGFAPIAMAGGRAVGVLKTGQRVWPWVAVGVFGVAVLVITAFLSLLGLMTGMFPRFVFNLNGGDLLPAVLASVLTLAGPWAVWLLGRRWVKASSPA